VSSESADPPEPPHPDILDAHTAELDIVEKGAPARGRSPAPVRPPQVRLGKLVEGGLAPAVMAVVERSVRRRPALASSIRAEIELRIDSYPPFRVVFGDQLVLVEDGLAMAPDLRVEGTLPDLVSLMVAPLVRGVPSPMQAKGRAALGLVALGRVRFQGGFSLMRKFLALIRV
jgi:hypothetical protein